MDILVGVALGYGVRWAQDKGYLKALISKFKKTPAPTPAPVPVSTPTSTSTTSQ